MFRPFSHEDYFVHASSRGLSVQDAGRGARLAGTYHRARAFDGFSAAGAFGKLLIVAGVLASIGGALANAVDFATDVVVLVELWETPGSRTWFVLSLVTLVVTIALSVLMLLRDRRYPPPRLSSGSVVACSVGWPYGNGGCALALGVFPCRYVTAAFQVVSLGPLYEAVTLLLVKSQAASVVVSNTAPLLGTFTVVVADDDPPPHTHTRTHTHTHPAADTALVWCWPTRTRSPHACVSRHAGPESIQRLKTLEALTEAAPQLVLQLYIAVVSGYTRALATSMVLSIVSLAYALAAGDKAAIQGHAYREAKRVVKFPLPIDTINYPPPPRGHPDRGVIVRIMGKHVSATADFVPVLLLRTCEVAARLGLAAFVCAATGWYAAIAGVVAAITSALWWVGTLPLAWASVAYWRDVWEAVIAKVAMPQGLTVPRLLVATIYTMVAFPGVADVRHGTRLRRATVTKLTMDPWMGPLWSEWTLLPRTFCVMRTTENLLLLAVV